MRIKNISLKEHISLYMAPLPKGPFLSQGGPIWLHNLRTISSYLKTPTPLMKLRYNLIIHITEGKFYGQAGTDDIEIGANSILFITEGRIIARKKISKNIRGYCMIIDNKALSRVLSNESLLSLFEINPVVHLSNESNEWLEAVYNLLYKEVTKPNSNHKIVDSLFQVVLHKLLATSDSDHMITRERKIAFQFRKKAYQNFIYQKEISFYAREFAVSENYLTRCVSNTFGKPPKRILLEISILHSQLLLQDFSKQISEVAFELNYNDPSYFGRIFKQITSKTPSEYRGSLLQDLSEY